MPLIRSMALVALLALLCPPIGSADSTIVQSERYIGSAHPQVALWFAGNTVPGFDQEWTCDIAISLGQVCFELESVSGIGHIELVDDFGQPAQFGVTIQKVDGTGWASYSCTNEFPVDLEGVARVIVHVGISPFGCFGEPRVSVSGTVFFSRPA